MIGKSDLIILGVATAALTVGVGRWYVNTSSVDTVTIPASARSSIEEDRTAGQERNRFTGFVHVADVADEHQDALRLPAPAPADEGRADPADTSEAPTAVADSQPEPEAERYGSYTVKSGDYLSLLANRYNTTVSELQALNDIDGTVIHVGQELRYPRN